MPPARLDQEPTVSAADVGQRLRLVISSRRIGADHGADEQDRWSAARRRRMVQDVVVL